ncbi:LacI family DNA-binding transcriptional regulator [Actinocrispum wychmicini]|uniref:DNA-binding LacI/PurR family transcriptional regulator n=1 Tax=Actinocrispum wychmicini TaxID=1213861 RepID=A0A4R2JG58_9PSEU|nr:GntR family transcriptional regulator [Actinocrispum wychmicini]TCO55886.1 DNA-binding LacI/PurR family transcriptional regulator [Actinocrispum wychmicini]
MTTEEPPLPRYQQVKRELREAIARREYTPGQPFITQRQVCERFKVSTTTAVRALNDLVAEGVLVRQQGRGTFVADRQETTPARQDGTRSIACVIHGRGPIKAGVVSGVESVCADLSLQMVLFDSKDSLAVQEQALRRALDSGVSGVVLYPVQGTTESAALSEVRRLGIPLVMVDRYLAHTPTDAVIADHFAVGHDLTDHLIGLGHRRMAILWDETDCTSVRDRLSGHLQALRAHGIPERPDFTVLATHQRLDRVERIARLTAMLDHPEPPTVLICSDGYIVATAAADLAHLGVEVPGQVELAGMDDAGPLDILPLTIAAAVVPAEQLGRESMRLLVERINAPTATEPQRTVLPITIHTRDTAVAYLQVMGGRLGA